VKNEEGLARRPEGESQFATAVMTNYRREGGPLHIKSYSANVHESEFAQSPSDFSSKLHIALKEANETMNWLNLLHDTGFLDDNGFNILPMIATKLLPCWSHQLRR